MLKQVAKTNKTPTYLTSVNSNQKPMQPSNFTSINSFNKFINNNSVHHQPNTNLPASQQQLNNNIQVNNLITNLSSINANQQVNYPTFMSNPLINNLMNNNNLTKTVSAHSSNSDLINSTINSVIKSNCSNTGSNKTANKNKPIKSKGRPPKNQQLQQQNVKNTTTSAAQTKLNKFNLHQMSPIINHHHLPQQQHWTPNLNDLQKHIACQQQQLTNNNLNTNNKTQQTTTSSSSNRPSTVDQMNKLYNNNNVLKMQQNHSTTSLLNSNVNTNHLLTSTNNLSTGSIYDHQSLNSNKQQQLDYASLINGNGLINLPSNLQQVNQLNLSMLNNLNQFKNQNPEQAKLLMITELEKFHQQQMGSPYVPTLACSSSSLNKSSPYLNELHKSNNNLINLTKTTPILLTNSNLITSNQSLINYQMNSLNNISSMNSQFNLTKQTVQQQQQQQQQQNLPVIKKEQSKLKFNIASICEDELKNELNNSEMISNSKLNDELTDQNNRAIESNSPSNSSESNYNSSNKYMKLKKNWLNSYQNTNDQLILNSSGLIKTESNESSLDLLAETSLKQRTNENINNNVKQETDLKCKELFNLNLMFGKKEKLILKQNHHLEDKEIENDKLTIDEDDKTSISSNNASSSESENEKSSSIKNNNVTIKKKSRASNYPKTFGFRKRGSGQARLNKRLKENNTTTATETSLAIDQTNATNLIESSSTTTISTAKQASAKKAKQATNAANKITKRLNNKSIDLIVVQDNNSQFSNCSSANSINSERSESITRNSGKISVSKSSLRNQQQEISTNLFCNLPISQLKKTGQPFLQEKSCIEVAPKLLDKCRECYVFQNQNQNKKKEIQPSNIFCRFYAFRKLFYDKNELKSAGFSDSKDANDDEKNFWLPGHFNEHARLNKLINLNFEDAKSILSNAGDQLCDLINEELRAMRMHCGKDQLISWKRVVQGVREMCDVCETTLFNVHWTCLECGFCVCIECYVGRLNIDGSPNNAALPSNESLYSCGSSPLSSTSNIDILSSFSNNANTNNEQSNERDAYNWLLCKNDKNKRNLPHQQCNLHLTQIVTGDVLYEMAKKLHSIRSKLNMKCNSSCCKDGTSLLNGLTFTNSDNEFNDSHHHHQSTTTTTINEQQFKENKDLNVSNSKRNFKNANSSNSLAFTKEEDDKRKSMEFFGRDRKSLNVNKLAPRVCKLENTLKKHPRIPHEWLCDGRLLCLTNPELNEENIVLFKEQWIRGQPILVANITDTFEKKDLWTPGQLSSKMTKSKSTSSKGSTNNTMFNCRTNEAVNITLSKFWEGFEIMAVRVKDNAGNPLCLKLKDWPPGDDFYELMPDHFSDFFNHVPLPSYAKREGSYNLASRLPTSFVKPDLGPKMYTAYGCSATLPDIGTTNLHLDISDAINALVYVTVAKRNKGEKDLADEQYEYLDSLKDIDRLSKDRMKERKSEIGALWHIFEAKDADKIRQFLRAIAVERKLSTPTSGDPIHDQNWYLTSELRERLKEEYGVVSYAIVQLLGDAVFIPAGAPHQVRNIHSSIKLACDFVSPENVNHCFDLTGQFRMLSSLHSNHEDKLQIKNILYHAVKDALTVCEQQQQTNESNQKQEEEKEMLISKVVVEQTQKQFEQNNNLHNQLDNNNIEESNKRDALKSTMINVETNGKRSKALNVNERTKRAKLNENTIVESLTASDLNESNLHKRKRDEPVVEVVKPVKKSRKEQNKTLKLKS